MGCQNSGVIFRFVSGIIGIGGNAYDSMVPELVALKWGAGYCMLLSIKLPFDAKTLL